MDYSGSKGCGTENRNSTDRESSCSSIGLVEGTPNLFGKRFVCHHCNLSFLKHTELDIHRKTHLFPNKSILNQNKSPNEEREEEESNITLCNKSAILVNETDYHTELSMNETSNITEVIVNDSDQLLVAVECDTNNKHTFVNETSNRSLQTMSRNPDIIIINGTDTNSSSGNKTHYPYTSLNRQFVQREYFSESELDHVDNTPIAERPKSCLKMNRKKIAKNRQLLFPGKYLKKLPSKKKVNHQNRKSPRKSSDVASNESDDSDIICRDSEKQEIDTNVTTFEDTCETFGECVNETCISLVNVDETCINTVMTVNETPYSQAYVDETQNNSVNLVNETSYSQFSIDETCNNAMIPVNETCNSEVSMERTYITPGDVLNIGEQNNTDLRIGEMSLNQSELVEDNSNSGSDMNFTINISQSEMNSEVGLDRSSFQENVRRGITTRKKGKLYETTNLSVSRGRFESTRANEFNRSSKMYRKSKSDSELLSFTCMEAISTPQPSTSKDVDKISNFTETSSNGSYVFEKNHNIRENLEDSSLTVVGESIGPDNLSESLLNEAVMISRSRLDDINDGNSDSMMIVDSDIDDNGTDFEDHIPSNQQHRDLSVTNVEVLSNNQEDLHQSEEGNTIICSESSNSPSSSCGIHQAQDGTSTGGVIASNQDLARNIADQKDFDSSDSENEVFNFRESNPIEWLNREHQRSIEDWCIGIERTEFKCKYCEEVCESHVQLSIHVYFKHRPTQY
ncbi:hypothetical protein LSTR_LSTR000347 [Laodelphax striatellus]|uniref:C2H2-type domain-containing protein n=1 Tax=Laodelphax striatellus TaxID=195883 RepID=A0A482X4M8_LAOST|nr:hypothetical protein LSTR_LSTR000347 [Laodelphax striatellus]